MGGIGPHGEVDGWEGVQGKEDKEEGRARAHGDSTLEAGDGAAKQGRVEPRGGHCRVP